MVLSQNIRAVITAIIVASISSQPLLAQVANKVVPAATTHPRFLIKQDHAEAIYRRLVEAHWTPRTGLFRSFPDTHDLKLAQQAATYEQAAMGILAMRFGDLERARALQIG